MDIEFYVHKVTTVINDTTVHRGVKNQPNYPSYKQNKNASSSTLKHNEVIYMGC